MRKSGIDKEIVILLITTLITVLTWTGMEIYRAYTKNMAPGGVEAVLKPLNPKIETSIFSQLEQLQP